MLVLEIWVSIGMTLQNVSLVFVSNLKSTNTVLVRWQSQMGLKKHHYENIYWR